MIAIPEIDEAQRLEAERKAREAFIMELLRQGNITPNSEIQEGSIYNRLKVRSLKHS